MASAIQPDEPHREIDLEKIGEKESDVSTANVGVEESESYHNPVWGWLSKLGVEVRGIEPVPEEERVKTDYYNIYLMWMAIMCNLLP